MYLIGAAAHLECLVVAGLWVADQKPETFEQYQPKISLGQAARQIRERSLIDPTTVKTLKEVAELRNSVVHRVATYGIPFPTGDPSKGEYNGRNVFTDPEGLRQLMSDVDEATKVIGNRLREAGLGTGKGTPA
jgi:hypothetical protein